MATLKFQIDFEMRKHWAKS